MLMEEKNQTDYLNKPALSYTARLKKLIPQNEKDGFEELLNEPGNIEESIKLHYKMFSGKDPSL